MTVQNWIAGESANTIAVSIESGLNRGRARPGELLPTVRDLADSLKVSPATVAAAYRTLRHRGLISGQGRRGTRVAMSAPHPASSLASSRRDVTPPGATDLASGDPDAALLPPLAPALATINTDPRLYSDANHFRSLTTFAAGEFDADGVDARFVAVVSGARDGIERILREHLRPGDQVAVEDPGFPGILDLLKASGYGVVPVGVDDEGPVARDVDAALRRRCHALVITPRGQNPTGAAITDQRGRELRRILLGFPDVVVIENDCVGPIAGSAPLVTVGPGTKRWSVVRSTSKFLGPDLRVAVMAGDELTIARVRGRQSLGPLWVSTILQQLVLAMWSDPASGRRLARAADTYALRRAALLETLGARGVKAHGRSGLNVWVPVREESTVTQGLSERGWAVAAGERFRTASAPGIRVTVSTLAPPDSARFAAALVETLDLSPTGSA